MNNSYVSLNDKQDAYNTYLSDLEFHYNKLLKDINRNEYEQAATLELIFLFKCYNVKVFDVLEERYKESISWLKGLDFHLITNQEKDNSIRHGIVLKSWFCKIINDILEGKDFTTEEE